MSSSWDAQWVRSADLVANSALVAEANKIYAFSCRMVASSTLKCGWGNPAEFVQTKVMANITLASIGRTIVQTKIVPTDAKVSIKSGLGLAKLSAPSAEAWISCVQCGWSNPSDLIKTKVAASRTKVSVKSSFVEANVTPNGASAQVRGSIVTAKVTAPETEVRIV
jgi:hypothetical protein